jgi:hypothetical protein
MKLFEGEKIVSQSTDSLIELTLTSHRICYEYSVWGTSYNKSIALEHITSCENKYTSQIGFIALSVVSLIIGFSVGTEASSGIGFLSFIVFVIIYTLTRQNNIIVGSPSTRIRVNVSGMKREKILEFIDLIDETIDKKTTLIHNSTTI